MTTKIKITFFLIVLFVLGVLVGATLNRALVQNRIRRTFADRNPAGFTQILMDLIQPTQEQKAEVKAILDRYSKRVDRERKQMQENMQKSRESLQEELSRILTPEQIKRLNRRPPRPFGGFGKPGRPDRGRRPMKQPPDAPPAKKKR
jgi:C-terminal processing protease CtpA/Prc